MKIDIFLSLNNVFLQKIPIQIAKSLQRYLLISLGVLWLSFSWQDVATDCIRPNTNTTPFEVTRQDKISHWANIQAHTAAGQPG